MYAFIRYIQVAKKKKPLNSFCVKKNMKIIRLDNVNRIPSFSFFYKKHIDIKTDTQKHTTHTHTHTHTHSPGNIKCFGS